MSAIYLAFMAFTLYAGVASLDGGSYFAAILFALASIGWGIGALAALPERD